MLLHDHGKDEAKSEGQQKLNRCFHQGAQVEADRRRTGATRRERMFSVMAILRTQDDGRMMLEKIRSLEGGQVPCAHRSTKRVLPS